MQTKHRFSYRWKLSEANFAQDKGKVFSCFACGGGSSMGYKLAGYDVVGCNELDPRMNRIYVQNLHPRINYICDIRTLVESNAFPEDLRHLDILDGSPPCSSFSMSGVRSRDWGKEKYFKEGQKKQVLDTLFFDFIHLAKKLQPKVVIAENVKGLILGEAKTYVARIYQELQEAGYEVRHFLLNAQYMGVPQYRERVIFCALRRDLAKKFMEPYSLFGNRVAINMDDWDEPVIPLGEISDYQGYHWEHNSKMHELWSNRKMGDVNLAQANKRLYGSEAFFSQRLCYEDKVCPTLTSESNGKLHFKEPCFLSNREITYASTFPEDYDFMGHKAHYLCGMSVPPVMMAQIATRVWDQWLSKI